jgi:hypothetical protein
MSAAQPSAAKVLNYGLLAFLLVLPALILAYEAATGS